MDNSLPLLIPLQEKYPRNRAYAPSPDLTAASTRRAERYRAERPYPNAHTLDTLIKKHPDNVLYAAAWNGDRSSADIYVADASTHEKDSTITGVVRIRNNEPFGLISLVLHYKSTGSRYGGDHAVYAVDSYYKPPHQMTGALVLKRVDYA